MISVQIVSDGEGEKKKVSHLKSSCGISQALTVD